MHKKIMLPLVMILLSTTACIGSLPGFLTNLMLMGTSSVVEAPPIETAVEVVSSSANPYEQFSYFRLDDGAWVLGVPDAPITIVEFADFNCPHCQSYKPTMDQIVWQYVLQGMANYEFRPFPILGDSSVEYAKLAICAGDLTGAGLWYASDILFDQAQSGASPLRAEEAVLGTLQIDFSAMNHCAEYVPMIEINRALAAESGVAGTPSIRVRYNGGELETIPGYEHGGGVPLAVLEDIITEAN